MKSEMEKQNTETAAAKKKAESEKVSVRDFWSFFRKTSAVGLAIGVVMAESVNKLINVIVNGLVTPLISLFIPKSNLSVMNVSLGGSVFKFGDLLAAVINIFIVSLLVYLLVRVILKNDDLLPEKPKKVKVKPE